jgi:hypothetical protein
MRSPAVLAAAVPFGLAALLGLPAPLPAAGAGPSPAICFAPGTTPAQMQAALRRAAAAGVPAPGPTSLAPAGQSFQFGDGDRWSATASNGGGLRQGDPTTLTWSVVPDGTPVSGFLGEPSAPSNLRAFLNGIYGSQAVWRPIIEQVFARWSELAGITYVFEPSDDGAPLAGASGQLGVRGDIRIGGHLIDGNFGVLAYNFFPNNGDMILDTADSNYTNTNNGSRLLRNTLAHEHGHGLGLSHVCPINGTKLMEPLLNLSFDGPRHDDVLAANRGYGDRFEHNDSAAAAAALGTLGEGSFLFADVSVDDNQDGDYYRLSVGQAGRLDLALTPVGSTYLSGPQNGNGSCSAGTPFDSLRIHDLGVEVLDGGLSSLELADAHGVGQGESVTALDLPGPGDFFLRVFGGGTNAAQLYEVQLTLSGVGSGDFVFGDDFESGDTSAWSQAVP